MLFEMKESEKETQPALFALGLNTCHTPVYISKDVMADISFTPNRTPNPSNDFNDIGPKGKLVGDFNRPNAELALSEWPLGTSYVRHYYGCISMVDTLVGRLIDFVDNSQEEWFVVFTSDHGFHLLDKVLMTKFTLWPQVTQVPLVIYGEGFTGGKTINQAVSLVDLYPTFEKFVGEKARYELKGADLQDIVAG